MSSQILHTILPTIQHFHVLGYWVALPAGGYLDVGDLLLFAIVGAILGDNLNFWYGNQYYRCLGWA